MNPSLISLTRDFLLLKESIAALKRCRYRTKEWLRSCPVSISSQPAANFVIDRAAAPPRLGGLGDAHQMSRSDQPTGPSIPPEENAADPCCTTAMQTMVSESELP